MTEFVSFKKGIYPYTCKYMCEGARLLLNSKIEVAFKNNI